MISQLRNFVPNPSISRPSVSACSSTLSSLSPVYAPSRPALIRKTNVPSVKSWVPSEKDAQFTFTSLLPNVNKPAEFATPSGPDQELIRLRSHIQKPRPCMGCKSDIQSTLQVSPDKIHHYCPMCCEVICRGCMRVTGCGWDCPGPFHGKVCATMKCCAEGRAAILLELLGQLDSYSLTSYYKLSFKDGPKITHLYGDKALTQYIQATIVLLMTGDKEDERLGLLESILISSTLLDMLSQTLLSSPFMKWHSRSELYMSVIKLIKTIFQSLTRPWMIINSEYFKSSTTGILSVIHGHQKIVWNRVIEINNQPNATSVKIDKLRESFPCLMMNVKNILRSRSESSLPVIQELLDNVVHVPLCYILENLFQTSIEMKKSQSDPVIILDDIEGTDSFPSGLVQLMEALLDLKSIYESNIIISQASESNIKSKPGRHKGNAVAINSSSDQARDDCEGKSNDDDSADMNYETKSSSASQTDFDVKVVRDEVEVVKVKTRHTVLHKQAVSQINGKENRARFKGTDADESQRNTDVGEKERKSTCSVNEFFEQVDTLTISSDESDSAVEVIHLN